MIGINLSSELALIILSFYLFPFAFALLWLIVFIKKLFFGVWLWQVKEYHLARFLDHFRTQKGKDFLFSYLNLVKIALLLWLIAIPIEAAPFLILAIGISFLVFLGEGLWTIRHFFKKTFRRPDLTMKTFVILAAGLALSVLILLAPLFYNLNYYYGKSFFILLLLIDLLSILIVSLLVLAFQPLTVVLRNRIIVKAKKKREREEYKNLIVIGITGSYGKTSTKEFLATILSEKFMVLKIRENQNSEIGISRCILDELKPDHRVFICEMGAYDKGKIKEVAGIAQPQIGVVTGVNEQHLALFGSMENLISAEGGKELIESLPDNGMAILNEDNEIIKSIYKIQNYPEGKPSASYGAGNSKLKGLIFCSTKEKTDLWAEDIKIEKDWLYFKVCDKAGDTVDFKVNLVGRHNIENILLAAACAKELGMTLPEIAKACEKITPQQGAMKLVQSRALHNAADIIDATYSANPDGVMAALEHLKLWQGKKLIVMPCLIELGKASKEVHQRIGAKIAQVCNFAVITTKDWFEEIRKAAVAGGMKPENIIFSENPQEIFEKIKSFNYPEDAILLEGRLPQKLKELLKIILN